MKDNFSGGDNMWNKRFLTNKNLYTTQPNIHFSQYLEHKKPGKILLPGDGEGRNGVHAAKLGWEVMTFDYSEVAVKHTQELANENNVSIKSIHDSIEKVQFDNEYFDVIAIIFLHLPGIIRSEHFPRLLHFLKKGGELFILGFNKQQINYSSGGPKNEDMLFSKKELEIIFSSITIKKLEEFQYDLNEGPKHQGTAELIQFEGVK